MERVEELFAAKDPARALAYLANSVRRSPTNQVAAGRALSALIHQQRALYLTQPLEHQSEVVSAHFSPDGQRIVTASVDKTSRVWEMSTGRPLTEPISHGGPVRSAQFSPDGQRVLTASDDQTAEIWSATTGRALTAPLKHDHLVIGANFSADGTVAVTFSADTTARLWNAKTGEPTAVPLKHKGRVAAAAFSPNGRWVVTASHDETAQVWIVQTGQPLTAPLRHYGQVVWASFSADSDRVATASSDKSARVWDTKTGEPLTGPLLHEDGVASVEFSPDGTRVVTASSDKTARIWDARTGHPIGQRLQHQDSVTSARFSRDGRRIVTASWDRSARIWDATTGQPVSEALIHRDRVRSAEFSPDGERVVSASTDGAHVWETTQAFMPVPPWVPRLMEVVATKRINDQGVLEPVPDHEMAALKQELLSNTASNVWVRCGRWLVADHSTRTISPFSTITLGEHVEHLMEKAMHDSPDQAVAIMKEADRLAPRNGLVKANLARAIFNSRRSPESDSVVDFYSHQATKLAPDQPETWRVREEIFKKTGRIPEALAAIEAGLAIHPQNSELWYDQGRMLAQTNRLQEAYQSFTKAISFAQAKGAPISPTLPAYYLSRSYLLSRQGRLADAAADFRQAREIPPRDPSTAAHLVDLSPYYNVSLVGGCWHGGPLLGSSPERVPPWDLSEIPRGVQKLAGVNFDIRGAIQVGGPTRTEEFHPAKIAGIVVNRPCNRLHFLHAAIYGGQNGMIGKYVVHFESGNSAEIPLIGGRDLDEWRYPNYNKSNKSLQVALDGGNSKPWLYKTSWENPFPNITVNSIDFEASQPIGWGPGFPFLVALTAE